MICETQPHRIATVIARSTRVLVSRGPVVVRLVMPSFDADMSQLGDLQILIRLPGFTQCLEDHFEKVATIARDEVV